MALAFVSTCLYGYVLDCYPIPNAEAFVALNMRNALAFGMSYVIEYWLVSVDFWKEMSKLDGTRNEWLSRFTSDPVLARL